MTRKVVVPPPGPDRLINKSGDLRIELHDLAWALIVMAIPAVTVAAAFGIEMLWRGWL